MALLYINLSIIATWATRYKPGSPSTASSLFRLWLLSQPQANHFRRNNNAITVPNCESRAVCVQISQLSQKNRVTELESSMTLLIQVSYNNCDLGYSV